MVPKEEEWEVINQEFGINIYTLLYIYNIDNQRGNYIQYPMKT